MCYYHGSPGRTLQNYVFVPDSGCSEISRKWFNRKYKCTVGKNGIICIKWLISTLWSKNEITITIMMCFLLRVFIIIAGGHFNIISRDERSFELAKKAYEVCGHFKC